MVETKKQTIQLKDIIKELGLENLSIEKQAELIDRMSKLIYQRILLQAINKFSEEEAAELNQLLGKENYEKVDEYIRDKCPEFVSILKEELKNFEEEMIKKVKERVV